MRQVILLGRAGSDGELRYTPNKTAVFSVSICVSEKRADAVESHWFDVTVWARSGEIAKEQVKKGCEVMVIGKLSSRSYTDAQNRKVNKVEVVAERIRVTAYKREVAAPNFDDPSNPPGKMVDGQWENPPFSDEDFYNQKVD